jgi:hypothetical protein
LIAENEMQEQTIEYDEGKVTLSMPQPGIFASEVIGYMRVEEARAFIAYGDQIINQHGKLRGFHDWTAVMGYTNECRLVTTEWSMRRLAQLEEVHIALHSPLVRAAVAVANIGLRGRITMHHSVESLLAARAAAR